MHFLKKVCCKHKFAGVFKPALIYNANVGDEALH